jgi:hypothetical protein
MNTPAWSHDDDCPVYLGCDEECTCESAPSCAATTAEFRAQRRKDGDV